MGKFSVTPPICSPPLTPFSVNHNLQAIESAIEEAHINGIVPSFTVVFAHRPSGSETELLCVVYLPSYQRDDVKAQIDTIAAISRTTITYSGIRPFKIMPLEASLLQKSSLGKLSRPKIRAAYEAGTYTKNQEECDRAIQGTYFLMLFSREVSDNQNRTSLTIS